MSDINSAQNRVVWCDIPVADLDRVSAFYRAVLATGVEKVEFNDISFAILAHDQGNGACLMPNAAQAAPPAGGLSP